MQTPELTKRFVQTKPLVAATMVALAVALPYVFHSVGIPGTVILPMHIPVLVMGLLFGPAWGAFVGLLAPGINTALTGMPPIAPPIMQFMTFELAVYGFVAGWARHRMGWGNLQSLTLSMILGRVMLYVVARVLGPGLGLPMSANDYVVTAVVQAWPGIALQIVALPFVARYLQKLTDASSSD